MPISELTAPAPSATTPPAASPVPTAAPALSCGPPETMPLAIPGPKMPRPSRDRAARTIAIASAIVGVAPPKPFVNSENNGDPIPTMTERTKTFTPEEMMLPRKRAGSEEHTSAPQAATDNSYADVCMKKKKTKLKTQTSPKQKTLQST